MKLNFLALFVLSLILTGCMSAAPISGPSFSESRISAPSNSMAVIYIFREYAEPYAFDPTIHVNGKKLKAVPNKGFVISQVAPGNHKISAVWPFMSGQRDSEVSFDAVGGKEYFVELVGVSRSGGPNTVIIGSGANLLDAAVAQEKISKCCKLIK